MTILIEFTIPADSFPLGQVMPLSADLHIEVVTVVPIDDTYIPYVWFEGSDEAIARSEACMQDDARVARADHVGGDGDRRLFRVEWARPITDGLIADMRAADLVIDRAAATGGEWRFSVLSEERDNGGVRQLVVSDEYPITIHRLLSSVEPRRLGYEEPALTAIQRETLVRAFEAGYFEIPREITLEELSEEFDVSRQAVTHRLQRAVRSLVETACAPNNQ